MASNSGGKPLVASARSDFNIEALLSEFDENKDLRERLAHATVVFIPGSGHGPTEHPLFPANTRELFRHFSRSTSEEIQAELASSEEDYLELTLHAEEWILPILYFSSQLAADLGIGILANYLYERMKQLLPGRQVDVKSELIVKTKGGSIQLKYTGPAQTYENSVRAALDAINETP